MAQFPKKIGTVFLWRGRMWRRGRGILYAAHPADPTIERAYRRREKRRVERRLKKERRLDVVDYRGTIVRLNDKNRTLLTGLDVAKAGRLCHSLNNYRPLSSLAPYRVQRSQT